MKVYLKEQTIYEAPIKYVLGLIEKNIGNKINIIANKEGADIFFDDSDPDSETIAINFYEELKKNKPNIKHWHVFEKDQVINDTKGEPDYIATIFYMVNCLQEFDAGEEDLDSIGRFKYTSTYQNKYESIERNMVQEYINRLSELWNITSKQQKSTFFISHDLDTIYGSFFQDGLFALKRGRIDIILKLILNEFVRKPDWRNIDKIIKIESEHDIKTTFFWLVNKGKGELGIKNADYFIQKEIDLVKKIENSGFINGLHKSCSKMSLDEELDKHIVQTVFNRYHFLKFLPHKDWVNIQNSRLNFDGSLGYAERYGFRNSYGMAFQPYDIERNKPFDFVVAPLHFMDGTFRNYMKIPAREVASRIINFYEKNTTNCLFSLLWHNTYFTSYKYGGFFEEYKKIISYIYESKIECVTPKEIIENIRVQ